jgi:N-acetylneuraminate synthase
MEIKIGKHLVGESQPVYFIAEIGANHDGYLERAIELIHLAASSGANAAKFQNFKAPKIVSDYGFKHLNEQKSHQAKWGKNVFDVYQDASIPFEWSSELHKVCNEVGIDYFSSPYDFDAVEALEHFFPAIKVGSGDITWLEILRIIASKQKPVLLATGASTIGDVQRAVDTILSINSKLILLQCNTNYTGSTENFNHIHLNVLKTYSTLYPNIVIGLSDHTPGHSTVLGAVALGARVIEKHFSDDKNRSGPDHSFAMEPKEFQEMVERTRELERALGSTQKFIAENEKETVIIQRRCLRAARDIQIGKKITREMIDVLRPSPIESIPPYKIDFVIGLLASTEIPKGEAITWRMLS